MRGLQMHMYRYDHAEVVFVKGNFHFNLQHWAETAEPDRGSRAESSASAAAGPG